MQYIFFFTYNTEWTHPSKSEVQRWAVNLQFQQLPKSDFAKTFSHLPVLGLQRHQTIDKKNYWPSKPEHSGKVSPIQTHIHTHTVVS